MMLLSVHHVKKVTMDQSSVFHVFSVQKVTIQMTMVKLNVQDALRDDIPPTHKDNNPPTHVNIYVLKVPFPKKVDRHQVQRVNYVSAASIIQKKESRNV